MESIKQLNVPKFLLVVFILCTIVSGLYSAIPVYEQPNVTVTTDQIPEYQLTVTNDSWVKPERILLTNLTPRLDDPSWHSSEWRQGPYDARIETIGDTTTHFFNNQTLENETYTWADYARWDLLWPVAVLNYSEVTAEWHIRVLRGNITSNSYFSIARGVSWMDMTGSYIPGSSSEMNGSVGDEITLVSTASNFTEQFTHLEVGLLRVELDLRVAQGSIVAVDFLELWISTDENLSQVTLDFQTLSGESLLSNPTIVSQWLGTADIFSYTVGKNLIIYMRFFGIPTDYGWDQMAVTRSNQTAYLPPGNYSLALGWSETYSWTDQYIFNMTIHENSSILMNVPLPFNPVSVDLSITQLPGRIRFNYLNSVNFTETEDYPLILPGSSSILLQVSLPGSYWRYDEVQLVEGASSVIAIDLKLVPLFGVCFTSQQIIALIATTIFAFLSLLVLLYRWHSSNESPYRTLPSLILFVAGIILPWYIRTDVFSDTTYLTYYSPIFGTRIWSLENQYSFVDSLLLPGVYFEEVFYSMTLIYTLGFCLAFLMYDSRAIESLIAFSITTLFGGIVGLIMTGGLPWFGFWFMLGVPFISYFVMARWDRISDERSSSGVPTTQDN